MAQGHIRKYRDGDLPKLREITVLAFEGVSIDHNIERKFGLIAGKDWKFRKARHIDWDVQANPDGVFIYELDGEIVGYITTRLDYETKIGWIPNMAVHPNYQGKGIGKQLMETALNYLREAGMEYAKIETLEQNKVGSAFYPKVGFVEVARQIHYLMKL